MEDFKVYLPKFLSPEQEALLFAELEKYPENIDSRMFSSYLLVPEELYQGDCLSNIATDYFPGKEAKCIILSNTCDMSEANIRHTPKLTVVAPLFSLKKYAAELLKKLSQEQVNEHISLIQKQNISNMFYLPIEGEESFARLDMAFHLPTPKKEFLPKRYRALGNYGFYLLLFKLSIHFCRMRDGINRDIPQQAAPSPQTSELARPAT